ncbi:hypothetical protein DSO57_1015849 [Entomophthora muscae]|nr:hypothetical protein DSO57_1015849 [Entomophthora muscae]
MEYTVNVSYMEIYMERIRDLLNPRNDNLPIHEEKNRGVYVKGLMEIYVSSIEEVYQVMRQGSSSRAVAHTNMNAESSRSHSIFVVTISQKNLLDGGSIKTGKLYLVDLAGSEKVGKTGASGQTLEEAKKINKSLSSLGMVINALTDGKSSHVPYRDSKLTRILQESLGGNSRTTLIINCSPAAYNVSETLSTLRFGMRAKKIRNRAKINQDLSPAELKALLKKAKAQVLTFSQYIHHLERELFIWRSGRKVASEEQVSIDRIPATAPLRLTQEPLAIPAGTPASSGTPQSLMSPAVTSNDSSRPWTPTPLADDEREEFLARENALMDTLSEKEDEIARLQKKLENLKKNGDGSILDENKSLIEELSSSKALCDKLKYENNEMAINCDTLEDHTKQLQASLGEALLKISQLENAHPIDKRKERLKEKRVEKIARIMSQPSGVMSIRSQENEMRDMIQQLKKFETEDYLSPAQITELKAESMELRFQILLANRQLEELREDNELYRIEHVSMAAKVKSIETDYEELLLNGTCAQLDPQDAMKAFQDRIQSMFERKLHEHIAAIAGMKRRADNKAEHAQRLLQQVEELMKENERLKSELARQEASSGAQQRIQQLSEDMTKQLEEFQEFKTSLAADLEERCGRIAELELMLEETQKEYQTSLSQNSKNTNYKRKMDILESHLEALVALQKQLTNQNLQLKKDLVVMEKKLNTRNDRINSLERLLEDSQNKHKTQAERFDLQLKMIKDRNEQRNRMVRVGSVSSEHSSAYSTSPASVPNVQYSRIAKPMRGGAAGSVRVTSPPPQAPLTRKISTKPRITLNSNKRI